MDKLQWCRDNAPDALKSLSDDEVLEYMETAWADYCKENDIHEGELIDNRNEINSMMDYMVLTLVREFGDDITFKGGYMLTKLMPDTARQTEDIDFSIQSSELYGRLKDTMRAIGNKFISDGSIASYKIKDEVREFMTGGIDMYDATGAKLLGIDVGWHDLTFGTASVNIGIADVNAFTVERMLADKVCAILSRKRFRRPKDIYDVYCITNCMDFDANLVNTCIVKRTRGAGADWNNYPFTADVIREYGKAYDKLRVQSIYKGQFTIKPSFKEVMDRFNAICMRLLDVDNQPKWSHKERFFLYE